MEGERGRGRREEKEERKQGGEESKKDREKSYSHTSWDFFLHVVSVLFGKTVM